MDIIPIEDVRKRPKLIEHHTKYKEIHREDKTIFISITKHVRLHQKLRKECKCNIPPKELARISLRAYQRTEKYIEKYTKKLKCKIKWKEIDKRVKERVLGIKTVL